MARAATLECVAAHEYPAPRLIPTHAGDPVGLDGAWLTLATSYVEGAVLRPTLGELRLLGEALGRLHALPVALPSAGGGLAPGHAAWHPAAAIPAALDRLDRVAALVPNGWRPLHGQFRAAVLAIARRLGDLPLGVVHGDAWPGNAVRSGPGGVTLIDWEAGGAGLPVLDLGHCLIESLLDVPPRGILLVRPDEDRIAAVASGYSSQRPLTRAERDVLLPAIRFATAYAGAIHLEQALLDGVQGTSMDARWARLRNRIDVSEAVVRLALPHLPGGP